MSDKIMKLLVIVLLNVVIDAAKILFVVPTPSVSHQVVFRPLYIELSKRGHNVTVITTDPAFPKGQTPSNLTEIDFHDVSYEIMNKYFANCERGKKDDLLKQIPILINVGLNVNQKQLESNVIQNLIKNDKFDLLVIEAWSRSFLIYSHLLKAPVIQMSSFGAFFPNYESIGAPSHVFLYPSMTTQILNNLTIWDKLKELSNDYRMKNIVYDSEKYEIQALKKVLGDDVPPLEDLTKNVHMMFLNTYPAWEGNRPVPPGVIHIGGIHQHPRKEIPKDLKNYIDLSKNGVIYFSFGTNVQPSLLPEEKIQIFVKTFAELPYNILWKWDKDNISGLSPNIKLSKWFPQSDLLRHPNIKLFITQGGMQSTDEAIVAGVPLLGIPMLGDQWYNVENYIKNGIGVKLELEDLTVDSLKASIETVIKDSRYKTAIDRFRSILYDQPQTALERAVWWTEYVIRHKGAKHLRAPAANMSWWKFLEMDLVLLIAAVTVPAIIAIVLILVYLLLFFLSPNNQKLKKI